MALMLNHFGPIDNSIEIVTPENIAFRYQVAGPFRRYAAFLIDLAIVMATMIGLAMVLGIAFGVVGLGDIGALFFFLAAFVLWWLYGAVLETYWNGQTPGKRAVGIRVLSADGQPISGFQGMARNLFRAADLQPMGLCLVGLICATMNRRFQRLGDVACGTMVVVEERQWFRGVRRISEPEALRLVGLIPPGFQVTNTMARALAAYVQRRPFFTWPRRIEVARPLAAPLRAQFGLPANTNLDQLLCALYHRTFIEDRVDEDAERRRRTKRGGSPFVPFDMLQPPPAPPPPANQPVPALFGPMVAPPAERPGTRRTMNVPPPFGP